MIDTMVIDTQQALFMQSEIKLTGYVKYSGKSFLVCCILDLGKGQFTSMTE